MKIYNNLVELMQAFQNTVSHGITFISDSNEDKFVSYSTLYKKSLNRLWHFQQSGLKKNDKLIVYIEDNEEFLITFWAALLGGIIPVPVSVGINDELKQKLLNIWEICRPVYLVTYHWAYQKLMEYLEKKIPGDKSGEFKDRTLLIENLLPGNNDGKIACINKTDSAFIQFSSGSTGNPRGIILSHENVIVNISANIKMSGTTSADSSLNWFPLTHDMGIIGFHLSSFFGGINIYLMSPLLFARNPLLWLEKASAYKVTLLGTSNFGLKHFLRYYENYRFNNLDLSNIRLIFIGAETISPWLCRDFLEKFKNYGLKENTLYPVYGLAEATVAVAFPAPGKKLTEHMLDGRTLKIGKRIIESPVGGADCTSFVEVGAPVENCRVRICDLHDKVLGGNFLGHIQVIGGNVTSGYLNDAAATGELFTKDGWIRTGDLGFLVDGKLTVTGRIKDVIFSNGRNFFPYDIERITEELPMIKHGKTAAVGVFDSKEGEENALLFVVYKKRDWNEFKRLSGEIKQYLYKKIGLSIKHVIPVNTIPRTTSGKKQHYKLRDGFYNGEFDSILSTLAGIPGAGSPEMNSPGAYRELKPGVEAGLLALWQETFRRKTVNPEDDFFILGGDSLKASYLAARISRDFHVEFDIEKLFYFSTIKKITEYITGLEQVAQISIPRAAEKDFYPLSPAQKRMFILNRLNNKTTVYNIPLAIRIFDKCDKNKIQEIFTRLIEHHESLRTGFRFIDNSPVQYIHKTIPFKLSLIACFDAFQKEKIAEAIGNFICPFNLDNSQPLFRAGLILYNADEFILVMDIHHIIADGHSLTILFRDFLKLYNGESLSPAAIQYKDYFEWYREAVLTNEKLITQKEYWLDVFKDNIPVLNLPVDRERPQERSFNGSTVFFGLESELSTAVKAFTAEYRVTIYIFILAVFNILLYKYSGQDDIVVGCPVAGRNYAETADITGLFINTLCIRNYPAGHKSFPGFLQEVKDRTLLAFKNQDYQFEALVESLNVKRDLKHNPMFDVMLAMQDTEPELAATGKPRIENYPAPNNTSMFDLILNIVNINGKISFSFEFNTDIFYNKTIRRLINHFINIIQAVMNNPAVKISGIKMISGAEEKQLLYEFNHNGMEYPRTLTFQEIFEQYAAAIPDHTAVIFNEDAISYRALNEQANRLAHYLTANFPVKPDTIIGIMLERSIELIVCLLAVVKAGAAYLPLNPHFPDNRLRYMIDDCRCLLVITREEFRARVNGAKNPVIVLPAGSLLNACDNGNPQPRSSAHNLLYTIYTSGTTGNPRAVMIQHNNFINMVYGWRKMYALDTGSSVLLQLVDFSFDVFAGDLGRSLALGGTMVICPREKQLDFKALYALIMQHRITILESTPSLIIPFIHYIKLNGLKLDHLKMLILGSDICLAADFMEIYAYVHPGTRLINSYGTTEATIDSTYFDGIIQDNSYNRITPIGKPFPNVKIYILNHDKQPQPVNIPGELCIGGDSVSRGYLFSEKYNAGKFVENPYEKGTRIYKTGDIARWQEDGTIEFTGRMDNQIKIRGYRINPVEIETMIRQHPGINDAIVITKEFFPGDLRLVAYVLTNLLISWEDIDQYLDTNIANKTCRRSEFRIQYQAPCSIKLNNHKEYECTLTNISYSGVSVKQNYIPVGSENVILSFPLPGNDPITISAWVNYANSAVINLIFNDNPGKKRIIKQAIDRMANDQEIIVFDLRRSDYRMIFSQPCTLHFLTGDTARVFSRDISFSGISLKTIPPECRVGENLEISMLLPSTGKQIRIGGVIIWKNEEGAGIKFRENNNAQIREELVNFIKHKKFTIQDLRLYLEKVLPEYMIPSIFVIVDKIPLTANGKVDRKQLPDPNFGLLTGSGHEPPSTVTERLIAKLWEDVLGVHEIGINDNFFFIGGNSIKALYAAARSRDMFTLSDLFKFPTIKQLAANIKSA